MSLTGEQLFGTLNLSEKVVSYSLAENCCMFGSKVVISTLRCPATITTSIPFFVHENRVINET
jgi:hypothetical protein